MENPIHTRPGDPDELVERTIRQHSTSLLRLARRHSYCQDDAHDAYQRALEIFIRRARTLEPQAALPWLRTVVKHEAWAVREQRRRLVSHEEPDLDREEARNAIGPDERAVSAERTEQAVEALQGLKPQEVRALVLKAEGHSYDEICRITGWTYTKVNRCLTEGRRSFRERIARIDSGRECERWEPVLSAMADGEASPSDLSAVRPHLRACPACRVALRDFHAAPKRVAALVPFAALAGGGSESLEAGHGFLGRVHEAFVAPFHERATLLAHSLQSGLDAVSAGKLAAVAASATALAAGGGVVAAELPDRLRGPAAADAARETVATPAPARVSAAARQAPVARPPVERDSMDGAGVARATQPVQASAPAAPNPAETEFDVAPAAKRLPIGSGTATTASPSRLATRTTTSPSTSTSSPSPGSEPPSSEFGP
jgi:RNA polymerase sigma factor (sigma-70 family)